MLSVVEYVQNIWPFSMLKFNDLRASDRIVRNLPIPESTKHFVYAIREPASQSVIYVLLVQNLSERSAFDADCLIREVKPDAVVVQVGQTSDLDFVESGKGSIELIRDGQSARGENNGLASEDSVPTTVFEVLKKCFVHKTGSEAYENMAGGLVLREIFGVSFNGHFSAAKKAAEEVGSSFFMLKSPIAKCSVEEDIEHDLDSEADIVNFGRGLQKALGFQSSSLLPRRVEGSVSSSSLRAFHVMDDVQSQMVKSLSPYFARLRSDSVSVTGDIRPLVDYEAPQFAKCVYPLLVDLHDMFDDIPTMKTALACAQKMLCDVNNGKTVDAQVLSEVYAFQVAVEGLRIALNSAGRLQNGKPATYEFSNLHMEDKSYAILAQALKSRAKNHKSIVAVVDASVLAGLRRHWNTDVPPEITDMVDQLVIDFGNEDELLNHHKRKRKLTDKHMVAVGAGATAILGASSLSKVVPTSAFIKVATFHVPSSLKLMLTQTQKAFLYAFGKTVSSTKIVAPGMASSTLKSSAVKAAASAEKIRAVTHGVIASAEKTSLSAMRTAFYEIMRKRRVRPIGALPWATFGCSVATCTGLLVYGDGIECVAESFPTAPSIANLGRGVQSLRQASRVVKQTESSRVQKAIDALLYKCKNVKT